MIDGYITYNELKIITGYSDKLLTRLLIQGMNTHELEVVKGIRVENPIPIREQVFSLEEVESWLNIHIF